MVTILLNNRKKDMKKLFLVIIIALLSFSGNAQKHKSKSVVNTAATTFSLGAEIGIPIGQYPKGYNNPFSYLLGGTIQLENHVDSDLGITLSSGYLNYKAKNISGFTVGFIPLMAGLKYYFSPSVYGHGQLGAAFGTQSGQGTSFAYSPGIGINITQNLDGELKYMGISNKNATLGDIGIRLAYNF